MKVKIFLSGLLIAAVTSGCAPSDEESDAESLASSENAPAVEADRPPPPPGPAPAAVFESSVPESERPSSVFAVWTSSDAEGIKAPEPSIEISYAEARGSAACAGSDLWEEMGTAGSIQITDNNDGTITVRAGENGLRRPVNMTVEHSDSGAIKNNLGYSTGRLLGNSLQLTTTFEGSNSPVQMHETFTLSEGRGHLSYTQVLINPELNELPSVNTKFWEFQPGATLQANDC